MWFKGVLASSPVYSLFELAQNGKVFNGDMFRGVNRAPNVGPAAPRGEAVVNMVPEKKR